MATNNESETNGCTILWKIENISHCWKKYDEWIESPAFIADALDGTKWSLRLYPGGISTDTDTLDDTDTDVFLRRAEDCSGPDVIEVNHLTAFLSKDGKVLKDGGLNESSFMKNEAECSTYEERLRIFVTEREAFLPEDTLTVQCSLWKKEEIPVNLKHVSALTVFAVNRRSFVWKIDDFSILKPGVRNKLKDDAMEIDLILNEGLDFEKKLVMDGISFDESIKYLSFKTAIITSEGEKEHYGRHEYFNDDLKKGVLSTLIFPGMVIKNKSRYLPNDTLSLYFEYLHSTGSVSFQFCSCGAFVEERKELCKEQSKTQLTPVLAKDLESMYKDGIFSDTELRTSTQTFPAHKNILSARSPVFLKMFSNDMKEKISGHVDITDLEDDTVHRMLIYIYTDSLEDLQIESASNLYAAADKYEILSLKSKCSSLLKDKLCPTKACDVLVLADLHNDDDLKSAVQDFILSHDKEVFGSQEWRHFMDTNGKLAAEVMFRKVFLG